MKTANVVLSDPKSGTVEAPGRIARVEELADAARLKSEMFARSAAEMAERACEIERGAAELEVRGEKASAEARRRAAKQMRALAAENRRIADRKDRLAMEREHVVYRERKKLAELTRRIPEQGLS